MRSLFAAYTIIWIVIFAYTFFLSARQKRLEEKLDDLRRLLKETRAPR